MSVWPLLLVAVVLAVDAGFGLTVDGFRDRPLPIALFAVIPTAIIVSLTWWRCVMVARQVRAGRLEALPHTASLLKAAQVLVILNAVVLVLMMDWLVIVRTVLGNGILLDELAAILPALTGVFLLGLAWYPLERTLAVRHGADLKGPFAFAWSQFSIHVLLVLIPALIILAMMELIDSISIPGLGEGVIQLVMVCAVLVVFLATPLFIRVILSVKPLDNGPLRERLQNVCVLHGVKIRDILLWKTGGLMLNAAVVGLVGSLRFVLLTDMLVKVLPEEQAEAVMAHEVGHVRLRHMPWLFFVILSLVLLA